MPMKTRYDIIVQTALETRGGRPVRLDVRPTIKRVVFVRTGFSRNKMDLI